MALCLGGVLILQLDTYRRLQSTLLQIHDDPGQNDRQIEALFSLFTMLPIRIALPPMRGSAISPDFAAQLASIILVERPRTVLELGSGASTIVGGYALESVGGGKLISFEESEEYANQTRERVKQHGLQEIVTVVYAPLHAIGLRNVEWLWYDMRRSDLGNSIDLLVVDGPLQTGRTGGPIRYPALPLLHDRLSPKCIVMVDDCHRSQEKQMVEHWTREFPDFEIEQSRGEKQHIVLRRGHRRRCVDSSSSAPDGSRGPEGRAI
jgi:predicted O-methyltransferase YrrM